MEFTKEEMELSKMTMEIFTKLEQQWLSTNINSNSDAKKTRILSIDGGGTSATVAGAFLINLEDQIQAKTSDPTSRIADFFDIIAGTGIGAMLATFLTAADPAGRPIFSAKEAVDFLAEKQPAMFKPKKEGLLRRRKNRRCSGKSLEKMLKSALTTGTSKAMTLRDTCKPILVPCYDLTTAAPFVFSRAAASASGWTNLDFELWKVCRASMATPSVFKPFELTSVDGKTTCLAVDGGLVMNNPTAAAVTHVLHNKIDFPSVHGVEDLLVMSLGNGALSNAGKMTVNGNGECSAGNIVDIAVDGISDTVDQMLGNAFSWNRNDYLRIQANGFWGTTKETIRKEEVLMERGIESLSFGGKRVLKETNGERIEGFAQRILIAAAAVTSSSSSSKTSMPPTPFQSLSPLHQGR